MKKNIFEIGAKFEDGWSSDNKAKPKKEELKILEPSKHQLYIAKEKRRGKVVTIIKPFYLDKNSFKKLLKDLKSQLGCGGTIKDNSLELQGEVSQKIKELLQEKGFKFRR